ncbi:MAG: heme ABC transporter ATP-binding protein [Corynebacterium sp.]|nr:heme ABC transporter ATP-binding protein [Corynebacterium sp.]
MQNHHNSLAHTDASGLYGRDITVKIGDKTLLEQVNFDAKAGRVLGLIGPNGAGKSSLLAAICGDLPYTGQMRIAGLDPSVSTNRDLAQARAVMLQDVGVSFSFLVYDIVSMGRRPWSRTPKAEQDEQRIEEAMKATEVTHLADRDILTLSGGEKARVAMARVFAQETPIVMFDEPTAALDIGHQEHALGLMRSLAKQGAAVIIVLHDLNAAAAYCDDILCIKQGRVALAGTVDDVYTTKNLTDIYGWPIEVRRNADEDGTDSIHVIPQRGQSTYPRS